MPKSVKQLPHAKPKAGTPPPSELLQVGFWLYMVSVALLPVGLGGDRPLPFGLMQIGLSLSCFLVMLDASIWQNLFIGKRVRVALGLLLAVCLWAFIQTQPFVPSGFAHPLWDVTSVVLDSPVAHSISLAPEAALSGLARLLTYIAVGLLAYIFAQDARFARRTLKSLWAAGSLICTYGLVVRILGNTHILWYRKWAYPDDLTATFVNRNHFAIYAGLIFMCGVALIIQSWRDSVMRQKPEYKIHALRSWIVYKLLPKLLLLSVIGASIVLSDSRAGLVLSLLGTGFTLFLHQIYLKSWQRATVIGVTMGLFTSAVVAFAVMFSDHFGELFHDYSWMTRSAVYDLTWRAIQDNPWLGYGLNGFEPEYRLYQQHLAVEFLHAHSDILESVMDLGIPFAAMLWTSVVLLLSGLWHGIRKRRQNGMFAVVGLAASFVVLGHACVDFDLQIPGVAVTWACLLGTGLAQSWETAARRAARATLEAASG